MGFDVAKGLFSGTKFCTRCLGTLILWIVWLALTTTLSFQIYIAVSREIPLPHEAIRAIEKHLAIKGLRFTFREARVDLTGNVRIEDIRLYSDRFNDPLATVQSLHFSVDPWACVVGILHPHHIHVTGAQFVVPAIVSPSGRTEPVVEGLELSADVVSHDFILSQLSGRVAGIPVFAQGTVPLQSGPEVNATLDGAVGKWIDAYLQIGRALTLVSSQTTNLESPRLEIALSAGAKRQLNVDLAFAADHADFTLPVESPSAGARVIVDKLQAQTRLTAGTTPLAATLRLGAASVSYRDEYKLDRVIARMRGELDADKAKMVPGDLIATAATAELNSLPVSDLAFHAAPISTDRWAGDFLGRAFTQPIDAHASLDLHQGAGRVDLAYAFAQASLDYLAKRLNRDLRSIVNFRTPPSVTASASFEPGWKLGEINSHVESGPLQAKGVDILRASVDVRYHGSNLLVDHVQLLRDKSVVSGSYEMDTASLDYRFLLSGRIMPEGISPWFKEWWSHFWRNFDFSASPPFADADVQGRWGAPHLTTVFVHVDAPSATLHDVHFDHARTTLFIRPDYYDALELAVSKGTAQAHGQFVRSVDLEMNEMRWMTYDVTSDLDISAAGKIFGPAGASVVEPFAFQKPPTLHITGRTEGRASPRGPHERVSIQGHSFGPFTFYDFPLTNLDFSAEVDDDDIRVQQLTVNFAGGRATGNVRLNGGDDENRALGFDVALEDASLGESIRTLEEYGARRKNLPPPPQSRFQQRLTSGKFAMRISADGKYHDLLSFSGNGSAEVTDADLAEINLLGALSQVLSRTSVLGFTSFRLTSARTNFKLNHDRLQFSALRLTGPTAQIEANGDYSFASKLIDFKAKLYPFDEGKTALANLMGALLTPLSNVLELRLTGDLDKPNWRFAYGPTSLLLKIAGANTPTPTSTPAPVDRQQPPPLLRR